MSIRLRLTLWYTTVLAVTLLVLNISVYAVLSRTLSAEIDRALRSTAWEVLRSLRVVTDPSSNTQTLVLPDVDVFTALGTYLQLINPQGVVLARSQNLGNRFLPVGFEIRRRATSHTGTYDTVWAGPERLRIYSIPIYPSGRIIAILQVANSLYTMDAILQRLRWILIGGSGVTVLLAGTTGMLLARQAMAPIERLSREAQKIGEEQDFSRRVEYSGPPDELGHLTRTFNNMLERLEAAYKGLSETYETQRRFIADASHELRTPLTVIRGNIDILKRVREKHPKDEQEAIEDISAEAERMSRLVDDLLTLARADAGLHLAKEPTRLNEVLEAVAKQASVLAGSKVAIETEGLAEADVMVNGNRDYLHRLFTILVDNAIKYSPPGSRVEIEARRAEKNISVNITDNGPGIPPEHLPHIFDRFYRADKARSGRGTGLGLAIAKWIAEEHGATITVKSTLGEGTTFTVSFPLDIEETGVPAVSQPA